MRHKHRFFNQNYAILQNIEIRYKIWFCDNMLENHFLKNRVKVIFLLIRMTFYYCFDNKF